MKYVLIIGDGMADNPVESLKGKTPLQASRMPSINALAAKGEIGSVRTVPEGLPPGSDTAILSIFGCDPTLYYTGRSPLEAAAAGIALDPGDVSYRCNMVAFGDGPEYEQKLMLSHSAGSIEGDVSIELVEQLFSHPDFAPLAQKAGMKIYPSPSFRHIAVQKNADVKGLIAVPPHDVLMRPIGPNLPSGCENAKVLDELMRTAHAILDRHPINNARRAEGKLPANGIWFWAEGTAVKLPSFTGQYGKTGAVISAVPLCQGIANLIGLDTIIVDGATGELDTNYQGKVDAAVNALKSGHDFVAIHIEAPDECTHNGDLEGKIKAIEYIDGRVIAPLTDALKDEGIQFRLLFLSDHKTLTSDRGHNGEPVPFMFYDSRKDSASGMSYNERCGESGRFIPRGTELMGLLFES